MTKARCSHGAPWFRDCAWCMLAASDAEWMHLWLNDAVFHYNVCAVTAQLVHWFRTRVTG